jgi:uncharacterized cysteine cluster protein YcgN (CxxCxxCC family)
MQCNAIFCAAYVRVGSLASKAAEAVRSCISATPSKADVNSPPWLPPLCATSRHMQCSKAYLFNHLVGVGNERGTCHESL